MVEIAFPTVRKTFYVPENLAECNEQEYKAVTIILLDYFLGVINFYDAKIQMISYFLGYRFSKKADHESLANLVMLSERLDSFFDINDGNSFPKLDFIDDKIPRIKAFLNSYFSCGNSFENMSYGQYADACRFFAMFNQDRNLDFLYMLTSILYNKKKERYSSLLVEKRKNKFKKYIHPGIVFGVYLQFAAFNRYLSSAEINWAGKSINFSILFEGQVSENDTESLGINSLIFTLAESGIIGKVDDVKNTNFWEVMLLLYDIRQKDLERKRQQNANNTQT